MDTRLVEVDVLAHRLFDQDRIKGCVDLLTLPYAGLDLQFGCWGLVLWILEKGAVTAQPVGIGFFGADSEVPEHTNLSHQPDCMLDLHSVLYERLVR